MRASSPVPLTLLIPMAGAGRRFSDAGFSTPKPFIDVSGQPMIAHVLRTFRYTLGDFRCILVMQEAHREAYGDIADTLALPFTPEVVCISGLTRGQACTVLEAEKHIPPDAPMLIANCDEAIDVPLDVFVGDCLARDLDGLIATFTDTAPRWSFARTDASGMVVETREKDPISDQATLGWYLFRRAADFCRAARDMIAADDHHNGEFYVCPVYNYLIRHGARIGIHNVPPDVRHGLGTPEEVERFVERRRP